MSGASFGLGGLLPPRFDVPLDVKAMKVTVVRTLFDPLHQTFLSPLTLSASDTVASIPERI